ncbi:MAG: SCO1664 family protein [Chloroflexi bacterium]|nr:SCO1664 family protein [Chloroflexota bacterium]
MFAEKSLPSNELGDIHDPSMVGTVPLLQEGEITDCKPIFAGSNYVYLLSLRQDGKHVRAIYKPRDGETPLWDFVEGTLYRREYAAYLVSQALQWFLVPPTVIRNGPMGVGALQWFVNTNPGGNYAAVFKAHLGEFKRVAAFDWLVNNADRKGSHCLEGRDGRLWLIDHGLTFHVVPKMRTVVWDFAGQGVPEDILLDLQRFQRRLAGDNVLSEMLLQLLSSVEVEALVERLRMILKRPVFPDSFGARYRVPWPPF